MKKVCVGYIRVSTAGQAEEGVSLKAQRAKIAAWATMTGAELLAIYDDAGISAKSASNRPGLQAALTLACQRKAPLVCYSLSRMARSTKDAISISERLEKSGADLVSLTESIDTTTAAGRMVFRMLAVLAEFEREVIGERTKAGMAYKRTLGQRISLRIPFGYNLGGNGATLTPDPLEQQAIAVMTRMRAKRRSYRRICRELVHRRIKNKTGRVVWYPSVVHGILRRGGLKVRSNGEAGTTR